MPAVFIGHGSPMNTSDEGDWLEMRVKEDGRLQAFSANSGVRYAAELRRRT
jgi:hypothetical protein